MFVALRRRTIIIAVILVVAVVACGVVFFEIDRASAAASARLLPVYSVERDDNLVALTFDAAWGADKTSKIMDILEEHNAKGTFFLVGFWIDKYEDVVREIDNRGFAIGNHSAHHPHLSTLSDTKVREELASVNQQITAITGKEVRYFRAPFGEYNNTVVSTAASLGMQTVQWDVDSLDWKGLSGEEIASRVLARAKSGSIILMHNNSDHVLDALPIILRGLAEKGLTPTTLDRLIYTEDYHIDNSGTQIKN